ncbi:MAG TPA: pyridoxal-phosphate dependent enzyme [Pseudomonadales bacterium]|nr:pyridoxal-phosphate dependent enzyme [Pseudomonadales bacterium]
MLAVTAADIARAAERIAPYARRTPLDLAESFGPAIACKAEHLQRSGSFKFRGALNRLLALDDAGRRRGVLTASTGNHGIAMATASRLLEVPLGVMVARGTDASIVARLRALGAEVTLVDSTDCVDAEREARRQADVQGRPFVSPYNDPEVVAGQGTIAVELLEQLADIAWEGVDLVTVAVGGGGLIAGIATWLAEAAPDVRVIGAQPAADATMAASVAAGRIVTLDDVAHTLSHSTAGGVEDDAITFPICRDLVAHWERVSEAEITTAVRTMLEGELQLVEGAAGVAFAAALRMRAAEPDARIAVISCGARLTRAELDQVLAA